MQPAKKSEFLTDFRRFFNPERMLAEGVLVPLT